METVTLIYSEKDLFLKLIEQFLARKNWAVSFSSNSPVSENTQHSIRLVALTKGKADFQLSKDFEHYHHIANSGELIIVFPSGYLDHHPIKNEYWTFQCIFWKNFIRLLYVNQSVGYWYHTFSPVCNSGQWCLQALSQLTNDDKNQPQTQYILKAIYHIVYNQLLSDQSQTVTKSMETYHTIHEYIRHNFYSSMTNRDTVAKALKLSPQHVSRLFKEFSDESFNICLKKLRLNYALNLLIQKELTLDEIAARSGFTSTGYFIKEFHKVIALTPGAYRQRLELSKNPSLESINLDSLYNHMI